MILPLGMALSKETDSDRLQELALQEAKKLCNADARNFYLRRDNELHLVAIHNDSLHMAEEGSVDRILSIDPIPFRR